MIRDELVSFETAKLAREKGFNVHTLDWYDYTGNYHKGFIPHELHECPRYKEYYAPTQSLLQRWLREEKGYYVYPFFDNIQLMWDWVCREKTGDKWIPLVGSEFHLFPTYEQSLEDALKYALENLV